MRNLFYITVLSTWLLSSNSYATEWLEGTDDDDTIVYGSLWTWDFYCVPCYPSCQCGTYWDRTDRGNGICVFARNDGGTYYRGSPSYVDEWELGENPYSLKGDDTSAGNGDDVIYPADYFGEYWIYCVGAYRIDMGEFPSTKEMRIYGDWSYDSSTYGGNDFIFGWNNRDVIYGGHGNDYVYGEDENDYIDGGYGNDYLYQNACNSESEDTPMILGGDDTDRLYGSSCDDWLYGENGTDYLYGYAGDEHFFGGNGNDTCGSPWPNPESGYNSCYNCEYCNDCDLCGDCSPGCC